MLARVADLRDAAGVTPIVRFTSHKLDLDAVQASGVRDLIERPFDVDAFESKIRALLARDSSEDASGIAGAPPLE